MPDRFGEYSCNNIKENLMFAHGLQAMADPAERLSTTRDVKD
jgi:hypothetical protein